MKQLTGVVKTHNVGVRNGGGVSGGTVPRILNLAPDQEFLTFFVTWPPGATYGPLSEKCI